MAKRRKLNSKNPKYNQTETEDTTVEKRFIREVNGVKVYAIFSKNIEDKEKK